MFPRLLHPLHSRRSGNRSLPFFVFLSLTLHHHVTAEHRPEAVEVGHGAVVQIVRQLLGLVRPRNDSVHHLETSALSKAVCVEKTVIEERYTCIGILNSTLSPRFVECCYVEVLIITASVVLLRTKVSEADQHGFINRNVQVEFPLVDFAIEAIQSAKPRRGHTDCVRQLRP